MNGNVIVGQSGGPTSVINSSLVGVFQGAKRAGCGKIYGMRNGLEGLLQERYVELNDCIKNDLDIEILKRTPSSFLGTCRYKLPHYEKDSAVYEKLFAILKKLDIKHFFYIGGNDSMDTIKKLAEYANKINSDITFMGVPKTIDNDLDKTDHTPGYGSAAKYVASAMKEIILDTDTYTTDSITIVEIMGRNAGWLTASSALARTEDCTGPDLIYLPEIPFSVDKFVDDVKGKLDEYNSVIVVVSEGIKDENGEYISARGDKVDKFGHVMLSGTGAYLKSVVEERIGCKVRALEPSVLQRSAGHTASMTDVTEAYNLGVVAVKAALDGKTGVFSTLRRISDLPYTVDYYTEQVSVVANNEKLVPRSWINEQGNDVTNKMIEYLSPLVKGVPQVPYRNGLPDYIGLSHLDVKKQKYSD